MLKRWMAVSVLAALVAGCANNVRKPIEGRADVHAPPQVSFATRELSNDTAVGAPQLARDDAGNLLYVKLPIRSAINKTLYVDYRVTFLDRNGMPLSRTGWFTKTLEANVPDFIQVNSTSGAAADFQIDLRYAR